ncbi:hypothetical protein [Nocardiopsis oceani]
MNEQQLRQRIIIALISVLGVMAVLAATLTIALGGSQGDSYTRMEFRAYWAGLPNAEQETLCQVVQEEGARPTARLMVIVVDDPHLDVDTVVSELERVC